MFTLANNIHAQPESLAGTLRHHAGPGAGAMAEAAKLLRSGKKIVITGMGASLFASLPLQYFLCSQGIDTVMAEAGELLHYMRALWRDAVVLMVSRSGESVEIARLLEAMKGQVPILGVTNESGSLLASSADVTLSIASLQDEIVAIQTYTGTLLTLHMLASTLTNRLNAAAEEAHQLLPLLGAAVEANMGALAGWEKFLRRDAPVYLLARGPSFASAQEGALLFHEIAKSPAVAMPVASFRHGPVEVVDPDFRGFVFAPRDGTRDLNLALAHDVVAFGGQIRLVGPASSDVSFAPWCDVPAAPATLAPVFEIVPLQAAAYQMAVMRGVQPGSFRFAPQVATDEASFRRGGGSQ